jgi:drug/metabolite transporter (DMT)-like permease
VAFDRRLNQTPRSGPPGCAAGRFRYLLGHPVLKEIGNWRTTGVEANAIWITAAVITALILYTLRRRHRFPHGLMELAFSLGMFLLTIYPRSPRHLALEERPPWWGLLLSTKAFPLLTGIYVMVRGLDNIDEGLSEKWRGNWNQIFRGASLL